MARRGSIGENNKGGRGGRKASGGIGDSGVAAMRGTARLAVSSAWRSKMAAYNRMRHLHRQRGENQRKAARIRRRQ